MVLPLITCMGRLEHLRQTLPDIVEEFGRAVLVDWSCPDRSGDWAGGAFGDRVEVVRVRGQKTFHKTRALNAGIARARGDGWLLVLDADTKIGPGLRKACEKLAVPGWFAIGDRLWPGPVWRRHLGGILLVSRADLDRVGGYDEDFRDYGPEDVEMRCRLRLFANLRCGDLPAALLESLPHSDALRVQHASRELHDSMWRNGQLLAARVRSWTGRDIAAVPEIADLLISHPRRGALPKARPIQAQGSGALSPRVTVMERHLAERLRWFRARPRRT